MDGEGACDCGEEKETRQGRLRRRLLEAMGEGRPTDKSSTCESDKYRR